MSVERIGVGHYLVDVDLRPGDIVRHRKQHYCERVAAYDKNMGLMFTGANSGRSFPEADYELLPFEDGTVR